MRFQTADVKVKKEKKRKEKEQKGKKKELYSTELSFLFKDHDIFMFV